MVTSEESTRSAIRAPNREVHFRHRTVRCEGGVQESALFHVFPGLFVKIRMHVGQEGIGRAGNRGWHKKHRPRIPVRIFAGKICLQSNLPRKDKRRKRRGHEPLIRRASVRLWTARDRVAISLRNIGRHRGAGESHARKIPMHFRPLVGNDDGHIGGSRSNARQIQLRHHLRRIS